MGLVGNLGLQLKARLTNFSEVDEADEDPEPSVEDVLHLLRVEVRPVDVALLVRQPAKQNLKSLPTHLFEAAKAKIGKR